MEAFREVMRVNVEAVFALSQAVAEPMRTQGSGSVINISSMFSLVAAGPGPEAGYVASKSALNGLTRELASQWARHGIRVNAVAPGWMEGDWMKRMLKDKYDDLMGKRAKSTPLKRVVTAEDVAETMMSLVQGNRFVTGEIIVIDGGFTSST